MIENIILVVISFLLTSLAALVGVIWRSINKRTTVVEVKTNDIVINYLDRFKEIAESINELKVLVKEQTVKCQTIQDLHKEESKYRRVE